MKNIVVVYRILFVFNEGIESPACEPGVSSYIYIYISNPGDARGCARCSQEKTFFPLQGAAWNQCGMFFAAVESLGGGNSSPGGTLNKGLLWSTVGKGLLFVYSICFIAFDLRATTTTLFLAYWPPFTALYQQRHSAGVDA